MKRIFSFISMSLVFALLLGCTNQNIRDKENEIPAPQELKIEDYFPIRENVRYIYEGEGNEYASYNLFIDYTAENKVQQRIDNGGTVTAAVIELSGGRLTKLLQRGEVYYRENFLQAKGGDGEILLMEPLKSGTAWNLADSRTRTITDTEADITTPLGSFKAIEVVTKGENDKTVDYYVKDIGLVKTVFVSENTEITSSLSRIEEGASLTQSISFFYPDINSNKIYYRNKDISFKTNDITRKVMETAYKQIEDNSLQKVFSENTKINSLYLNEDGMVYIDLNREFITGMNAGALYETMILQSIANTFGKYYNSEKVVLTIDNKPYESGHIAMKKGEYLKVKYDNTVEIK